MELPAVFAELIEDYFTKDPERLWNLYLKLIGISPEEAPVDNPKEIPPLCGACAIGASGSVSKAFFQKAFSYLEELANDSRWRIRGFLPRGPSIVILVAPGFLFFICWRRNRFQAGIIGGFIGLVVHIYELIFNNITKLGLLDSGFFFINLILPISLIYFSYKSYQEFRNTCN